jgi:predicted SAM-dependent methyltransferase
MRLHLGCGKRDFPGFVNVDFADHPHIHHRRDVRDLGIFPDASAELIYASHLLQYFDREEALQVLREWYRVLRKGGILRLAVPDLGKLVEVYGATGNLSDILGPLFGKMAGASGTIYHRTVYDYTSLRSLVEQAGFREFRTYDWRATDHAQFDDHSQAYFPHMQKELGLLVSLNVEAAKP